ILLDGWSGPLLSNDLFAFYQAASSGRDFDPPPARPYRDYIDWLQRQDLAAAEAFWRGRLEGFSAPTPLPLGRLPGRAAPSASAAEAQTLRLDAGLTEALRELCRRERLTLSTLVQGVWALLLGLNSGQDDVVFGTTVSGRSADLPGVESMVGLFINTLPTRVRLE